MSNAAFNNIAIIGVSGAIGNSIYQTLLKKYPHAHFYIFSRNKIKDLAKNTQWHTISYDSEQSIFDAANSLPDDISLDLVLVTTGVLHNEITMPEKCIKDLSFEGMESIFLANTTTPAMIGKYFLPKLSKENTALFAALSARVGSIGDNQLGGWYSYRASKAALNMIIKNFAIEMKRTHKKAIIAGLHPGTVDSPLSKPFQKNVPEDKLFSPEFSAEKLVDVLENLTPEQSGACFDWKGECIEP